MPMNKREQAEVDELRKRDAMLRAVAWPSFPRPLPVPPNGDSSVIQTGYEIIPHPLIEGRSHAIRPAWRMGRTSYTTDPRANRTTGSQSAIELYATEQDASRAAAYILAEHFGKVMAGVYEKCF